MNDASDNRNVVGDLEDDAKTIKMLLEREVLLVAFRHLYDALNTVAASDPVGLALSNPDAVFLLQKYRALRIEMDMREHPAKGKKRQ